MVVTGLEFHRSFWDIITFLESIKHPSMVLNVATADYPERNGINPQGFVLSLPNSAASLAVRSVLPPHEGSPAVKTLDFKQTDNMYLFPRHGDHILPAGLAVPARRAHLSADLIYYWFTLCMGHKVGETKAAIGRKYALDVQKQMKIWLNILDEFHKYISLQD